MEPKLLWLIFLSFLTLSNAVVMALKIIAGRKNNPGHGERIAALEKGQEEIERRLEKIEKQLNEVK